MEIGSFGQRLFTSSARAAFRAIFRTTARVHIRHLTPIPRTGPLIMACNHISHFDPPFIGSFFPRHVDWMAMEELFRNPRFGKALEWTGAFKVHRDGSDRSALRVAVKRLRAGRVVGIFPEGGIRAGDTSILNGAPMRPGVGALAQMAQAPVLPCVVIGTDRLYHKKNWRPFGRTPLWFVTGTPLPPPEGSGRDDAREQFREALSRTFTELKERLVEQYGLSPADLPTTPQARKGEDPYA